MRDERDAGRLRTRASSSTPRSATRAWTCRCRSPSTTRPTRAPASSSGRWSSATTTDLGIRMWWLDACEPEIGPGHPGNLACPRRPGRRGRQRLPARQRAAVRRGDDARRGVRPPRTRRPCSCAARRGRASRTYARRRVVRATSRPPGSRCAQQVRAGLSIAIAGIPWWTTDIGGFHGGDPRRSGLPRADRPLVPVRRVLPAVPPARQPRAAVPPGLGNRREVAEGGVVEQPEGGDRGGPQRGVVVRRRGLRDHQRRPAHARTAAALPARAAGPAAAARPAGDAAAVRRLPGRRASAGRSRTS